MALKANILHERDQEDDGIGFVRGDYRVLLDQASILGNLDGATQRTTDGHEIAELNAGGYTVEIEATTWGAGDTTDGYVQIWTRSISEVGLAFSEERENGSIVTVSDNRTLTLGPVSINTEIKATYIGATGGTPTATTGLLVTVTKI